MLRTRQLLLKDVFHPFVSRKTLKIRLQARLFVGTVFEKEVQPQATSLLLLSKLPFLSDKQIHLVDHLLLRQTAWCCGIKCKPDNSVSSVCCVSVSHLRVRHALACSL